MPGQEALGATFGAPGHGGRPATVRFERFRGYLVGMAVVLVCTALAVVDALRAAPFVTVFPLAVLAVTVRFGLGPAILTAVGGILVFDFVFVPPRLAFAIPDATDGWTLAVMLMVGALTGAFAEQLRRQVQDARRRAEIEGMRNALLCAVSHDLRTPLTAIVTASMALDEERLDPLERREFSHMVAVEASRLHRLVGNLLDLTRLESGRVTVKATPQAIDEVIGSVLVRLDRELNGRVVRTDVPSTIPLASFDPVLIGQVVTNLVENVIRHTPPGSPIELSTRSDGRFLLLEVADRGPGVRPGDEERVFDKLYRGAAKGGGGTGLGLTICRAIMTVHDGRIWLENRSGGGAVVRLSLPISRSAAPRLQPLGAVVFQASGP